MEHTEISRPLSVEKFKVKTGLCSTYYPGDPWLGASRAPGSELVPQQMGCSVWEEISHHCTLLPESSEINLQI